MLDKNKLATLFMKTREEMQKVRIAMEININEAKDLQHNPDPVRAEQHRLNTVNTYARYRVLEGTYQEQIEVMIRLMEQYQSSQTAYQAGYDGRLADLLANAVGDEYKQLRELLEQITDNENWRL